MLCKNLILFISNTCGVVHVNYIILIYENEWIVVVSFVAYDNSFYCVLLLLFIFANVNIYSWVSSLDLFYILSCIEHNTPPANSKETWNDFRLTIIRIHFFFFCKGREVWSLTLISSFRMIRFPRFRSWIPFISLWTV